MKYWVVKGKPSLNDWDKMLKPGKRSTWHSFKFPKTVEVQDRIFFWESSPSRLLIALGSISKLDCGQDEDGRTLFEVHHATRRLPSPLSINDLRSNPGLERASFLKSGPTSTLFPLTAAEAEAIINDVGVRNPEIYKVWADTGIPKVPQPIVELVAKDLEMPPPERVRTTVQRIVRDTALAKGIKELHGHQCQICDYVIELPNGIRYSEAHHIQPLGAPHNGPDVAANVIVLCPNHHAMCDYGVIELNLRNLNTHEKHSIGEKFIAYHNSVVCEGRVCL